MQNKAIPNGWVDCSLGDVIVRVIGGGTPSRTVPAYWVGNIPWASVKDFKDDTQLLHDTEEHISSIGLANSAANLIEAGIPIVCTRMAVGRAALTARPIAINQDLKALYPCAHLDAKYLLLLLTFIRPQLESLSIGSTVKGINVAQLLKIRVSFPPLPEQHRIVEIMEAMDGAIAHTETLIAKLKQIKAGLLHDLLTRGLDENGRLRDAITHPEQFNDSLLGRIPKDWEVAPLKAKQNPSIPYIKTGPFGSSLKGEHWIEEGVPVITIGSIGEGELIKSELLFISEAKARSLSTYALREGELVFSRVADVGRSVVVSKKEDGWIMSSNLMRISLDQNLVNPTFVYLNISYNKITRQQIRKLVNSGGREIANTAVLDNLQFYWPSKEEQIKIVNASSIYDSRLRTEDVYCKKLKLKKKGLMHDLLTGRVRVNTSQELSA